MLTRKILLGMTILAAANGLGVSIAVAQTAQAQPSTDPTKEVEQVVVTAQRRSELLKDVPISVTVISGLQIERQRIQSLQDYAAKAPNIGFTDNGSSGDRDFTIRGVSNLGGFTRSNAIYVDEFNVTPGDVGSALEQNLIDSERIEILRGPQGVFFGRNVIGGAVSITSKKPNDEFAMSATGEFGSFDAALLRGMINVPLVKEAVGMRLNGYVTQSSGTLDNIASGPNNSYNNWGLRGALRFTPSSKLTIDLAAQVNNLESDNLDAVPTGEYLPALNLLRISSTVNSGEGFYPTNRSQIATNAPLATVNKNTQFTARFERDFGAVMLIGVNGYIKNEASLIGDSDQTPFNAYIDDTRSVLESYSTEWRIQSNSEGRLSWLAGIGYADDSTDLFETRTFLRGIPTIAPVINFVAGKKPIDRDTISNTKTLGVFANASYKIGDALTVSVGGRYSRDEVTNSFLNRDFVSGEGDLSAGSVEFTNFSPRISSVLKLNDAINTYATVSRGYKPGGFNFSVNELPELPLSFDPETAINYEAGIKGGTADGKVQGSVSVFWLDWQDLQVQARRIIFLPGDAFTLVDFAQNAEGATSKGVEVALTVKPLRGLTLSGGLGYNKATFGKFDNAVAVDGLGFADNGPNSRAFDATGNTLPLAPLWTGTISADYRMAINDSMTGFLGASYSYKSLQFQDTTNLKTNAATGATLYRSQIPAYGSVSLNAGIETEKWVARLFVDNALDGDYYVGSRGGQSLSGTRVVVVPRTIRFQITVRN